MSEVTGRDYWRRLSKKSSEMSIPASLIMASSWASSCPSVQTEATSTAMPLSRSMQLSRFPAMDHEIADFAAALDSASDAYCLFELNCKADTVLLDGMNKEIAQTIMSLVKNDAGMSYYTTPYPFGFVMVLYSERRNIQSIVYARRRPFRIFF